MSILSRRNDGSFIARKGDGRYEADPRTGIIDVHGQGVVPSIEDEGQPEIAVLDQNDPGTKVDQEAEKAES